MTNLTIDILGLNQGTPALSDEYPAVDVNDPTQSPIGSTKKYLIADLFSLFLSQGGLITLPSCQLASTVNLNATYNNGISGVNATLTDNSGTFAPLVLDGVAATVSNTTYYLIKDQTLALENGIYILVRNGNGTSIPWQLMRVFFFNSNSNIINGQVTSILSGLTQKNTSWQVNVMPPVVVGVSAINFNMTSFGRLSIWNDVTGTSALMIGNNGYVADNVGLVSLTLPANIAFGQIIEVAGNGSGGWTIVQNAGQRINDGILSTSVGVGGSLSSTHRYDAVKLLCVAANTTFNVLNSQGNLTVV